MWDIRVKLYGSSGCKNKKEKYKKMVVTRMRNGTYKHSKESLAKMRGRKRSEEFRKRLSNMLKGKKWTFARIEAQKKVRRSPHSKETKKKMRVSALKRVSDMDCVSIGKNEKEILDNLEKFYFFRIIRQLKVIGYSVDGYIPELNLVIEVDEYHHFNCDGNLKKKDIERQKNIEEELGCQFIRIIDNYK